jgi:hypothetical protein
MASDAETERGAAPPSVAEAIGGPVGVVETSLPGVVYVLAYAISGSDTTLSAGVALAVALVLAVLRLARRETPRHAFSGLLGVAIAAFVATRSGRAEDFYLPGLLLNAAYAAAFLISIAVRRPLVGLIAGSISGEGTSWREDPQRMRSFARASWLWVGLFLTRLSVQLPLYFAGAVVALGVARTAMGIPLFAIGIWLTWRLVRRMPAPPPPAAG